MEPISDYYVYVLFRSNAEPFYVGKGRRDRWMSHQSNYKRKPTHKNNIIALTLEELGDIPKIKVAENLTSKDACDLEILLIKVLGRRPNGPLVNRTAGGEGALEPTDELRQLMRDSHLGKILSDEHKANIGAALRGRPVHPNTAEAVRQSRIGAHHSDATKERIRIAMTGRVNGHPSEETRRKISDAQKGKSRAKQSEDTKLKRSEKAKITWASGEGQAARPTFSMAGRTHSDETKAKMRAARIGIKMSPETRAKMSAAKTGKNISEETKTKMRAAHQARRALIQGHDSG